MSQSLKNKTAFLTIDDSPSSAFISKMNYLKDKNIPAVFFCIGNLMEKYPDEIVQAIHKGFVIANHSYAHPSFSKISVEECKEEISKTDKIIEELYQRAEVKRPAKWFRFPYGDKGDKKNGRVFSRWKRADKSRKSEIQKHLAQLGYTQPDFTEVNYKFMSQAGLYDDIDWSWTFDIMEWALSEKKPTLGLKNMDKIFKRMEQGRPSDCRGFLGFEKRWMSSDSAEVILLHDHEETNEAFFQIIDKLSTMRLDFEDI